MTSNQIKVHTSSPLTLVNEKHEYCYYCEDGDGEHVKIKEQFVIVTSDGSLDSYCSSFLVTPSSETLSYHSSDEETIGDNKFDLDHLDSDIC